MKTASWIRAAALAASLCIATTAMAQEKTGNKEGFTLKPGTVRIVLMRPVIDVGAQATGGMFEPNADWTTQAREYLTAALGDAQSKLGNAIVDYSDQSTGDGPTITQYSHLFNAVADSVIRYQFFPGNRLPTKKHGKAFEWGMGNGLAHLASLDGADYALFITTHDEYGSAGRKMLQIVGMLGGVGVTSGVHQGYAGLVDLKTGELVWLNADQRMGGDVRTADGAQKRVAQLLEGFPGKPAAPAAPGQ